MGVRSSARRARATEQLWRERSRRAVIALAAAAVVLPLATVSSLVAVGASLGPRPAGEVAGPAAASPRATADVSVRPAQTVVASVLGYPPAGWVASGPVTAGASDPLVEGCDARLPSGVTSASRGFDAAGQRIAATVTAFGAGVGPVAVRDRIALLATCPGITTGASSTVSGVDAFVAWRPAGTLPAVSVLGWRRGDVLISVYAAGTGGRGLSDRARALDTRVLSALDGRCADVSSTLADAARSPYVEGVDFTGLLVPVPVDVTPLATPDGAAPLPTPSPVPSLSYPVRPADPVWPVDLPSPVGVPVLPADPGPEPTATAVSSRAPDPVGPGCGWAFTGVLAPELDAEAEAATVQALVDQARDDLLAGQERWRLAVEAYRGEAAAYDEQLAAFLLYADEVRQVAESWDAITAGRDAYLRELAAWEASVQAARQFALDQEAARSAYDAAVAACDAVTPTPLPTGSESPTPDPLPTGSEPPTPEPTPTPSPTVIGCPPDVPPILFALPPTVLPSPTPPPDPTPPSPTP